LAVSPQGSHGFKSQWVQPAGSASWTQFKTVTGQYVVGRLVNCASFFYLL